MLTLIVKIILFVMGYHLLGTFINIAYWDYVTNSSKQIELKLGKILAIIFIPLIYLFSKTLRDYLK